MHYAALTHEALILLGWHGETCDKKRAAEDIREKILAAGQDGMAYLGTYLGKRYCVGYMVDWFDNQPYLINPEVDQGVVVPLTEEIGERAIREAHNRLPYIKNKDGSPPAEHFNRIVRGFIVEFAVRYWFRKQYPSLYTAPANWNNPRKWCNHDFRIKSPRGTIIQMDVAGPHRDGLYGATSTGKPIANIHVLACRRDGYVHIMGFKKGADFQKGAFAAECAQPISRLLVYLNMLRESECTGYDYADFKKLIRNL
jgi:hypothetical protein